MAEDMFCNIPPSWFLFLSLSVSDLAFFSTFLSGLCNSSSCLKAQEGARKLFKVLLLLRDQNTGETLLTVSGSSTIFFWQSPGPITHFLCSLLVIISTFFVPPPSQTNRLKTICIFGFLADPPFLFKFSVLCLFFTWFYSVPLSVFLSLYSSWSLVLASIFSCSSHLICTVSPPPASLPFLFFTPSCMTFISLSFLCLIHFSSLHFILCLTGRQLNSSGTGFA